MRCALVCAILACTLPLAASGGLDPRRSPAEYPVSAEAGGVTVAAEFHYRVAPYRGDKLFLRDGVVVEAALFGPRGQKFAVSGSQFWLRVNGKKALPAEPAGIVVSRDRLGNRPAVDVYAGDGQIRIGGADPRTYPGERMPEPPLGGDDPNRPRSKAPTLEEALRLAALPEGKRTLPLAGLVYFHYGKKLKSIQKLELIYRTASGETVTLKLR